MTSEPRIKVALVGGGIGGLCLAAGLVSNPRIDIHVYESVPEYKDIGAGLALHMNAIKGMDLIGPQVKKAYFDKALTMAAEADEEMSTKVTIAYGPNTGALVAELGKAKGRKTVARSDLLAGLMELIPKDKLSFGKRLQSIKERDDQTIDLTFKDGTFAHADAVIGCDGVHSVVRGFLLGEDHPARAPKNNDGWQIYRTLIPAEEARKYIDEQYTRTVPILCGPKGHINCMPLHNMRDVSAGVAMRGARKPGMTEAPELKPEDFEGYTKEAQDIVKMIARDTSASWTIMDHAEHAPFYSQRRVTMMGDAAHAAMPFAGNGAAQAIEDAAVINELFKNLNSASEIEALFQAYDQIRRPRSQKVVEIARDFGRLYGFAIPEYGDDPDKMRSFFGKNAAFTNNADLGKQNADAVELFKELVAKNQGVEGGKVQEKDDLQKVGGDVKVGA
ncbi:hypothetical protein MBLNU457_6991t1 [Dothideomycetes sp. NU457]